MQLSPSTGWSEFNQPDDVVLCISDFLQLAENGGIWEYYNFTETSSVWCSNETHATNQLQIVFDSDHRDSGIKSLVFELTNNGGRHFKQLFKLKKQLKNQFNIFSH